MSTNSSDRQKRIVQELEFDARTAKRVRWTEWEFAIEAPHQVRVTNASYGTEKADHVYTVTVTDHDDPDLFVPIHCDCPADHYNEEDCKHKVAVAVCGGSVLVRAAMAYESEQDLNGQPHAIVMTDGGQYVVHNGRERDLEPERARERAWYMAVLEDDPSVRADALGLTCPDWCEGPTNGDLPCFRCHFVEKRSNQKQSGTPNHDEEQNPFSL